MRKFLVSCSATTKNGNNAFVRFDLRVYDDERMTSELLCDTIARLKEQEGYQDLIPLAFSEYDREDKR